MKKKAVGIILVLLIAVMITGSALADISSIKPAGNTWENPENLVKNGEEYLTGGSNGYVVVWVAPECNVDGEYIMVENERPVVVIATFARSGDVPWGQVKIDIGVDENGETLYYDGWVMMSELLDENGEAVYTPPEESEPVSSEVTPAPETPMPTESANPEGVVSVSNTYNNAIVYTSLAFSVGALALVAYVLIKHKALNK